MMLAPPPAVGAGAGASCASPRVTCSSSAWARANTTSSPVRGWPRQAQLHDAAAADTIGGDVWWLLLQRCSAQRCRSPHPPTHPPSLPPAVAEVLRAIIGAYKDLFKVQQQQQGGGGGLSDALLFSNYGLAALVVDEVCREVRERCGAVRCECECGASASAVRCECAPPGGGGVQGWGVGGCVGCKGGRGGGGGRGVRSYSWRASAPCTRSPG